MGITQSLLALPVSAERDHIFGNVDAPLTLLEYGDYECPHCAAAHPIVKAVLSQAGDAVRFVFRHFPLTTVHPHAEAAAEAAEASGSQGRYWQMHDMLYANTMKLSEAKFLECAAVLGLNVGQFTQDMISQRFSPKVSEDFLSGVRSGVNGTPTFYVNDVRHDGSWDYISLLTALRRSAPQVWVT